MPPRGPHAKAAILLIDDSITDLRLLLRMMLSRHYQVNVAFSGRDGYHKAELLQPDLILLDVNMPKLDGFATCRLLKQNERTQAIPVLFLSALSDVNHRLEGLAIGAVDFIAKPFNEEEVLARVNIHLELARVYHRDAKAARADADSVDGVLPRLPQAGQKDEVLVKAAIDYLRQNMAEPPSTEDLVKTLGTHEKRLSKAFQTHFGTSVFGWLREERLQQAMHLLLNSQVPIASLGDVLGYSSPANFAKAFRDRFGRSPREVRQGEAAGPSSDQEPIDPAKP